MSTCRVCGNYTDQFEWPVNKRHLFRPNLCYSCYVDEIQNEDDQSEDESDQETDYCMPEVKPNAEDIDDPIFNDDDGQTNLEDLENDTTTTTNEDESLQNIKRMLFG